MWLRLPGCCTSADGSARWPLAMELRHSKGSAVRCVSECRRDGIVCDRRKSTAREPDFQYSIIVRILSTRPKHSTMQGRKRRSDHQVALYQVF